MPEVVVSGRGRAREYVTSGPPFREHGGDSFPFIARPAAFQTDQSEGCYGSNWPMAGRGRGKFKSRRERAGAVAAAACSQAGSGGGRTAAGVRSPRRRCPAPGAGAGGGASLRQREAGCGAAGVCQKGLGSVSGRVGPPGGSLRSLLGLRGHRPLPGVGLARPRAGCVFRLSCGRKETRPYAVGHLGAGRGAGAYLCYQCSCYCVVLAAAPQQVPPGGIPGARSRCSIKRGRGGTGWGACAIQVYDRVKVVFKVRVLSMGAKVSLAPKNNGSYNVCGWRCYKMMCVC